MEVPMKPLYAALLAALLCASPAWAGWTMYAPGQQEPIMTNDETPDERAAREAQDELHRKAAREAEMATPKRGIAKPKRQPKYTQEELLQGKPYDGPTNTRGPAPGGHRRHVWREKTGFNTPADRIRAENENRRLRRELKKERSRPNPGGDHPTKIRKSLGIKL